MLGMTLGLSPAAAIFQGGNALWRWTPAQLFAGGVAGLWPARCDPAGQALWQDALGSARALVAGAPVGKLERAFGTADAVQATALSRPALGCMPKGPKARNLLKDPLASAQWLASATNLGITATRDLSVEGEVRYSLAGTATATGTLTVNMVTNSAQKAKFGDSFTGSLFARIVNGLEKFQGAETLAGPAVTITGRSAAGASVEGVGIPANKSTTFARLVSPYTVANPSVDNATLSAIIRFAAGDILDGAVVAFRAVQLEQGTSASAYQPTDADGLPWAGYGAVVNMAAGAQAVDQVSYWPASVTNVGITATKLSHDLLTGEVSYALNGVATASSSITINGAASQAAAIVVGDSYHGVVDAKVTSGAEKFSNAAHGAGIVLYARDAGNAIINSGSATTTREAAYHAMTSTIGPVSAPAQRVTPSAIVRFAAADDLSGVVVSFRMLQVNLGTVAKAAQMNHGPNHVTQAGLEHVWFLVNDGNDALPVDLPAGSYGVAWANPAGGVGYTTQTLSGAGTIDALRGMRMADVIIRQGHFTPSEKALIETEWSKLAA